MSTDAPILNTTKSSCKYLGITKFNLFGHFNGIAVLQNLWLLLAYNLTFFTLTCLILFKQATQSIVKEVTYLFHSRVASLRIFKSLSWKRKEKAHFE